MKYNFYKLSLLSLCLSILILFSSCRSTASLNYMMDIDEISLSDSISNNNSTIQAGDQLEILVSALDLDAVAPFNLQGTQSSSLAGNASQNPTSGNGPTYIVGTNNTINFPVIGKINTKGLTLEKLQDKLTQEMLKYVANPNVQARILNYKITVLGEVSKPGTFNIPDGQVTMLSALGLAGDLTPFGVRNDVLVVRNENGKISKQKINLNSAEFINSPYYFLKQNDVVYVNPNKTIAKRSRQNPNNGLYLSAASITLAIITLLIR